MKLSEAIRLGAVLRPQAKRDFFVGAGSCALGAAAEAVGIAIDLQQQPGMELAACCDQLDLLAVYFPILKARAFNPAIRGSQIRESLDWIVPTLNDDYNWTRERIADWVETVEAAKESAALADTSTLEELAANDLVVK